MRGARAEVLPIPPDQFPLPDPPAPLVYNAQIAGWWARYGVKYTKARYRLRGMQGLGEFPQAGGQPHIETTNCTAGDRFKVWSTHRQTLICGWGKIRFGNNVFVNSGTIIFSTQEVIIGDDVALANEVYICDSNSHGMEGKLVYEAPVRIGRGSWIGARAIILPGVTIGERVMVAAGAVVTKDVPDDCLVGGNPATVIRKLDYPEGCLRAWHDEIWCHCPLKDQVAAQLAASKAPAAP
jgi:acetyltransferase-like isoleucine patch superfamily enzyme